MTAERNRTPCKGEGEGSTATLKRVGAGARSRHRQPRRDPKAGWDPVGDAPLPAGWRKRRGVVR